MKTHWILPALTIGLTVACTPTDDIIAPMLADVSASADGELSVVDRSSALSGAQDYDQATLGGALDPASGGEGFALSVDGTAITSLESDDEASGTYFNVWTGAAAAAAADLIALGVVAPPAAAIAVATQGTIEEVEPNLWYAENTVTYGGQSVTAHFTVAWVGVGWLAEMRISSTTGYDHTLWFNGFLAYGGGLGWWDFYMEDGTLGGVVEWLGDGESAAEFGIAATGGDHAGSWILYTFLDEVSRIDSWAEAEQEAAYVFVNPDLSGEVLLPSYNDGAAACWDAGLRDVDCD